MRASDTKLFRLIAFFKLLKALALIAIGIAGLKLVHTDLPSILARRVAMLGLGPGSRYVGRVLLEAAALTPTKIMDLSVGSFIYAGLFLTEGIGLWLLKRWAAWFTVIITSSLIPVEIYQISRHPTAIKVLVLIINTAIVAYLLYPIVGQRSDPA